MSYHHCLVEKFMCYTVVNTPPIMCSVIMSEEWLLLVCCSVCNYVCLVCNYICVLCNYVYLYCVPMCMCIV